MREIQVKGIYKHFEGNYYIVEDVGTFTETDELCVVYRALYGEHKLWIRPLKMFLSEVDHEKYPKVTQKYRFELQDVSSVAAEFRGE